MIIKIKGGLGNQMFQYAYGRAQELDGKKIIFDITFYFGNKTSSEAARDFKLNKFKIQTKTKFLKEKKFIIILADFMNKIRRKNIYYQGEKFFISSVNSIRNEFSLINPLGKSANEILAQLSNQNSVSVHVRRGDYISNKNTEAYHGVCGLDYYRKAIDIVSNKIFNARYYIFSDDVEWVKQNFVGPEYIIVSSPDLEDVEELILMSRCKHNIIANSSFSWWGAWLNANLEKIVIAPKKWFNDPKANDNDIVPEKWIKI